MARWIEPQRSVRTARQAAITALVVRALLCLAVIPATGVVAGAAASLTPAFGSVSLRAPAPTAGVLKYYIVGPPVNGRAEYLFDIAAKTLGNGNRYLEIFSLNQNRTQPDGGQLVDPAVLHSGWILVLPPDASGPGVLMGPLPTTSASGPQPEGSGEAGGAPPEDSLSGDSGPWSRLACFVILIGVMGSALWLLRRGRPITMPWRTIRLGPSIDRLLGPSADRPRPTARRVAVRTAPPPSTPRPNLPPAFDGGRTADPRGTSVPTEATDPTETTVDGPSPQPEAAREPVAPPAAPLVAPRHVMPGPEVAADPTDPHGSVVELEVRSVSGQDMAVVRLAGVRSTQASPAWVWLDPDAARPSLPTFVALGSANGGALCVDMAQAPDVLTVTGHLPGSRRLAASIARQLSDAGVAVTVVGTAVGTSVTGVRAVKSLAHAADAQPATEPQVVFCDATEQDHTAFVRQLTGRTKPRTVVVLVGPTRRARWSVHVQPPRSGA